MLPIIVILIYNNLFNNDKILKFKDIIKFEQLKIIYEFKSNSLPKDLNNLFIENKDVNYHFTRNVAKEDLYIPQILTKTFGTNSLKYSAAVLWNNNLKIDDKINSFTSSYSFKKYLKKFYLSNYNIQ